MKQIKKTIIKVLDMTGVTHNIPSYAIAAGISARIIKISKTK